MPKRIRNPQIEPLIKQARNAGMIVDKVTIEPGRVTLTLANGSTVAAGDTELEPAAPAE